MNLYDRSFTARLKSPLINTFAGDPVTFLIPRELLQRARFLLATPSGSACLGRLMHRHGPILVNRAKSHRVRSRVQYQPEGLDLVRYQFRVNEGTWARLSALAYGSGMSRCAVFSWMLSRELDPCVEVHTSGQQLMPFTHIAATMAILPNPVQIIRMMSIREHIPDFGGRLRLSKIREGPTLN